MEQDENATLLDMNSGMQDNIKGLRIATVIVFVVAICGIGLGVYGMIQNSQKDNQISDLKAQIEDLMGSEGDETTGEDGADVVRADSVITPKNYGFTADNFTAYYEGAVMSKRTEFFGAEFSLFSDGSVYMSIQGDNCKYFDDACIDGSYKREITPLIPGRVVDFSLKTYGNAGEGFAFFVLEDGTVASLSESRAVRYEQATIVDGSKNIFRLFGGGFAQDTSGRIYNISLVNYALEKFEMIP